MRRKNPAGLCREMLHGVSLSPQAPIYHYTSPMDARLNPYSPGAGVRPAELAGRDRELEDFDVLRHRAIAGRSAQPMVLTGLRGVGKTVLLNEMLERARSEDWIVAKVEA